MQCGMGGVSMLMQRKEHWAALSLNSNSTRHVKVDLSLVIEPQLPYLEGFSLTTALES